MTDSPPRTELSDLVRSRRTNLGLSLRKLAERCVDPEDPQGEPLWKFGVIDRLERRLTIIPPLLPALRALAAGLQVSLPEVQDAAGAQFFGIDTVRRAGTRAMVRDYEAMSSDDQERLRLLMEAWNREHSPKPDPE